MRQYNCGKHCLLWFGAMAKINLILPGDREDVLRIIKKSKSQFVITAALLYKYLNLNNKADYGK